MKQISPPCDIFSHLLVRSHFLHYMHEYESLEDKLVIGICFLNYREFSPDSGFSFLVRISIFISCLVSVTVMLIKIHTLYCPYLTLTCVCLVRAAVDLQHCKLQELWVLWFQSV